MAVIDPGGSGVDGAGLHRALRDVTPLPVSHVVICAGQVSSNPLDAPLRALGRTPHVIGGADVAAELDAKRAISQGSRLAAAL